MSEHPKRLRIRDRSARLSAMARECAARLRSCDLEELRRLAPVTVEADPRRGGIALTVYHDDLGAAGHRFVVQAGMDIWWGLYTLVEVDGFGLDDAGDYRDLSEEETWDFI